MAGRVADIHYLIPKYRLQIHAEHFQKVNHNLLGIQNATIKEIPKIIVDQNYKLRFDTNSNGSLVKNEIIHRKFIPINESIFSIQTKLGNITSLENKEILNDNKFSLGGSWLRGFDIYGAGPRNSYTSYQGGNNIIVTKFDYDRPINKISDKNEPIIYLSPKEFIK